MLISCNTKNNSKKDDRDINLVQLEPKRTSLVQTIRGRIHSDKDSKIVLSDNMNFLNQYDKNKSKTSKMIIYSICHV